MNAMHLFISDAHAQSAAPAAGTAVPAADAAASQAAPASAFGSLLPLLLVFVVFYFFLIRPQQKRLKDHQAMIAAVKRGDKVLTGGGIVGVVTKLEDDDIVHVEIAPSITVKVSRGTLSTVYDATDGKKAEVANISKKSEKPAKTANDNR